MYRTFLPPLLTGTALVFCSGAAAVALTSQPGVAPAPGKADPKGVEFFETRVRPVLAERCYACHSGKSGKAFGGLKLDTVAGIRQGGDRGPLFQPGQPAQSLLLQAVHYNGLRMPPAAKLPPAEVAVLEQWVTRGAPLPAASVEKGTPGAIDIAAGKKHWAFRPVAVLPTPRVSQPGWPRRKIDAFVLQKLEAAGIRPSPEADPRTWLRRVSLDLTGLPPTYEEVEAFAREVEAERRGVHPSPGPSPKGRGGRLYPSVFHSEQTAPFSPRGRGELPSAYERVVDRLLASPRYGERWGRHWLDVARYAEDNPTSEATNQPPGAPWRYRDWVIEALNADVPYNRFVRLQLAADLLPDASPPDRAALGFIGLAPVYHKEPMLSRDVIEQIAADEWDERLDTVTRGFLGLTVACARCHDHKFDPITTKDYYALAGVMASTQLVQRPLVSMPEPEAERLAEAERDLRNLERDRRRQQRERSQLRADASAEEKQRAERALAETEAKIEKIRTGTPYLGAPLADVVRDAGLWVDGSNPNRTRLDYRPAAARDLPVFIRGSVSRTGEVVPRRFLAVLSPGAPQPFRQGSGRLELANAILTDAAPLAARVLVNRVWGWHFGRPLVDTPSNFGKLGGTPTHPELLNDLAARFIQSGWSLKWLHREIVLSATYRQTSDVGSKTAPASGKQTTANARHISPNPQSQIRNPQSVDPQSVDPENRLLWRMERQRLDVEGWRDSMLKVSGALDPTQGGPSGNLEDERNYRRTIYGRVSRQRPADVLRLFDFPDANRHGESRTPTTTPTQGLYFLNSPFVRGLAERLAGTVADQAPDAALQTLYRAVLQRDPSAAERSLALQLVQEEGGSDPRAGWRVLAHSLLASNEFLFAD